MGVEIERKYLLAGEGWRAEVVRSSQLRQGYLSTEPGRTVRVRLVDGEYGYLTIKGPRVGDRKPEFEYEIPWPDACHLLDELCKRPLIEKTRHLVAREPGEWVVDEFAGDNAGLVLAEVEFEDGDVLGQLPDWLGQEVTEDNRYSNSNLQANPFTAW